jgi:hypothetical protein
LLLPWLLTAALWIVPKLLHLNWRAREVFAAVEVHAQAQRVRNARIVWILFDELSYKMALSEPLGERVQGR